VRKSKHLNKISLKNNKKIKIKKKLLVNKLRVQKFRRKIITPLKAVHLKSIAVGRKTIDCCIENNIITIEYDFNHLSYTSLIKAVLKVYGISSNKSICIIHQFEKSIKYDIFCVF